MKIIKVKLLSVLLLLLLFLIGCSNTTTKPDDVRQEIWDEGIKYYTIIENSMIENKELTQEEAVKIGKMSDKYNDLTEIETDFLTNIMKMALLKVKFQTVVELENKQLQEQFLNEYTSLSKRFQEKYLT